MGDGLKGIVKSQGQLGESYEDAHGLGELNEQLGESDGDCLGLRESVG